ncbi:MAG: glycosyltransferase family 39 protein, partial [Gemmatimonadota bacterium]
MAGLIAALLVLVAGLTLPGLRSGGSLSGLVAIPVAVALATAGLAVFGVSAWSGLAAMFVVGQGVTLQLVQAGNMVGYQHLMPAGEMLGSGRIWLAFLVLQAAIVLAVWLRSRPLDRVQLRADWRLFAVIGVAVLSGAALSRDPVRYGGELVAAAVIAAVQLANLALAVSLVPAHRLERWERAFDRLLGDGAGGDTRIDRFVLLAAAWTVLVAGLLARFVYQAHPHVPDEVSYLIQARYFAAGRLTMPAPPVQSAFDLDLMTFEPAHWYSPLPPAWPSVLAIGVKLGVPWLVNPVLTGVVVLLAWLFVSDVYDRRTARLTTLLFCVSPWFLWMGASLMNHQLSLACAMVAALGVARARRPRARRWPWLLAAGAALGVIAMNRPLEGLCLAILLAAWAFASAPVHGIARRLAPVAIMATVSALVASIQLAYNRLLTGSATAFPVMRYLSAQYGEGSNSLGFGPNRGFGWTGLDPLPGHGAVDVAINSALNAFLIDIELLGWSIGCLLPILVLLAWGRLRRPDRLMLIAGLGVVVAHAFYWFNGGPDFGARYWYLVLLPCLVLAVRGIQTVGERLASRGDRLGPTRALA